MDAKQRVQSREPERPDDLAANEGGCDRISLCAAPDEAEYHAQPAAIRGMSA